MLRYFDAHNHLQDERLDEHRASIVAELPALGLCRAVVAGSGEDDWPAVAALAEAHDWVLPSFGVHPWYVGEQSDGWLETLTHWLRRYPKAGVGEIGLDRWLPTADVPKQLTMFRQQWQLAQAEERAVTVHCLRAFGLLDETLRALPASTRGFLLHSYGGPVEMIPGFVRLGGYFSVSPYFLHPRKARQLEAFKSVPLERLLIETDAPDMWPPDELNARPLLGSKGESLNHPANIALLYQQIATLRGLSTAALAEVVEASFGRLFGR